MRGGSPAIEFRYRCAQDQKSKGKPRKHTDATRHRDRRHMAYFECQSHLNITLQVVFDVLTAKIDLKHMGDHVPYRATTVSSEDPDSISSSRTTLMKHVSA